MKNDHSKWNCSDHGPADASVGSWLCDNRWNKKSWEAGPESELELKKSRRLARVGENWQEKDACRGIIMPGMVNTHSHLGMIVQGTGR